MNPQFYRPEDRRVTEAVKLPSRATILGDSSKLEGLGWKRKFDFHETICFLMEHDL